jgi:nucleotide-binding universal stress UspA family protein
VAAQDVFKEYNLNAVLVTRVGKPVPEIVKYTEENHFDMVVIGAACKKPLWKFLDPWWMSPLRAYKLIESVEPPVLVVFCERSALRKILLCTSGAGSTDTAIEFAGTIAQSCGAVVNLFHVMPPPPAIYVDIIRLEQDVQRLLDSNSKLGRTLRRQKELLRKLGVFGEIRLRHGEVVPELLKELQWSDYDLVVSGSWPTGERLHKYVIGDVAREIVSQSELPVLVVRTRHGPAKLLQEFLRVLFQRFRKKSGSSKS